MGAKKFKSLKALSKEELSMKLRETENTLFQNRLQKATGQLKDVAALWRSRKDVARLKMLLGQKSAKSTVKVSAKSSGK